MNPYKITVYVQEKKKKKKTENVDAAKRGSYRSKLRRKIK